MSTGGRGRASRAGQPWGWREAIGIWGRSKKCPYLLGWGDQKNAPTFWDGAIKFVAEKHVPATLAKVESAVKEGNAGEGVELHSRVMHINPEVVSRLKQIGEKKYGTYGN